MAAREEEFDDESWTHLTLEHHNNGERLVEKEEEAERDSYHPLNHEECKGLFDIDGRLVKEAKLRKSLFEGKG